MSFNLHQFIFDDTPPPKKKNKKIKKNLKKGEKIKVKDTFLVYLFILYLSNFKTVSYNFMMFLLFFDSAGCGRTGTICAVDYAWDVLKCGVSRFTVISNLLWIIQGKDICFLLFFVYIQFNFFFERTFLSFNFDFP